MKKVIGIFLTMVFVFVVISIASGNEISKLNGNECYSKVKEFAKNGWSKWYNEEADESVLYGCGVISIEEFENGLGIEWSIENLEKAETEYYGLCECHVNKVGEIDGDDIYLIEAQSETKVLGSKYNYETEQVDEFYCGSVLFMVCEKY